MLYLLHGENFQKVIQKADSFVSAQKAKNPEATYFKINQENWRRQQFEEFLGVQGLFQNKYILILDELFAEEETGEYLVGKLKEIKESENIFIVLERGLTKELLKKIEKYAEKTEEFAGKEKAAVEKFNVFSLTDTLGKRDKKGLWVLLQRALLSGVENEQIHGILFWQIKAMKNAEKSSAPADSGLNPFVYKKSISFLNNYSNKELDNLSSELIAIYHDTRRGLLDFDLALEKFVLSI